MPMGGILEALSDPFFISIIDCTCNDSEMSHLHKENRFAFLMLIEKVSLTSYGKCRIAFGVLSQKVGEKRCSLGNWPEVIGGFRVLL